MEKTGFFLYNSNFYLKYHNFDVKTSLAELLSEKCSQKALRSFWKKVKKILRKRYGHSGKRVKNWKISSKSVAALLGKK